LKEEIADLKKKASLLKIAGKHVRLEKRGAEHWGCCPFHNEKSASFAISVKNGEEVFYCQGCGKGGDVIRFVEYIDHCTTKAAIQKLKAEFGIGNDEWREKAQEVADTFHNVADTGTPKVSFTLDQWAAKEKALFEHGEALDWLLGVRGIRGDTVRALHLGYQKQITGHIDTELEHIRDKGWILFPRIHDNKIVAVKMRSIAAKAFSQVPNMDAKALFNTDAISPMDPIFVTEGELDTAALVQAGYSAVSMPNANAKLTPDARIALKQAPCIFLAGDNDGGVGNAYMKQLQRELGENTFLIVWPGAKDANDFFLKMCKGNVEEFRSQVQALADNARNTPVEGFTSILQRLRQSQGTDARNDPTRVHFPPEMGPADLMNFAPAGSVIVLYSTYSGTGKSVFATQMEIYEAQRGEVVVVYSPELRDEGYLALLASQILGTKRLAEGGLDRGGYISRENYEETAKLLDKPTERGSEFLFYVGHSLPVSDTNEILDFLENTVRATGATRFVIDTLHRIITANGRENQSEAEGRVIKRLEKIGMTYGTTFILIGQSNKEAEGLKETKHDEYGVLRGSRELIDVSHGIYLLHRKRLGKENDRDILADEAELVLMKDRGRGPGPKLVPLTFVKKCSKFFLRAASEQETPAAPAEEENAFPNDI
jgi:KaiC/GvpD/RAD55 family RecA-like ATPase